jgi:hypothetical protein
MNTNTSQRQKVIGHKRPAYEFKYLQINIIIIFLKLEALQVQKIMTTLFRNIKNI